jgi:proline dehydrogenase
MAVIDRFLAPSSGFSHRFFFLAKRFVAGETIETALAAVRELNAAGMSATLDFLGEDVTDPSEARKTRDTYLEMLATIEREHAGTNVSVKLTALGLLVDEALCSGYLSDIVTRAAGLEDPFVRIDMEGSAVTDAIMRVCEAVYAHHSNTGPVIQAYLKRSPDDVEHAIALGERVRLCKGAYSEPPEIALQDMPSIRRAYLRLAEALLSRGNYPAIATHDERIIDAVKGYATAHGLGKERFEFQLLYGVRPDLQRRLAHEGYRVRIYVPFGTHWAGYFYRRITERKENVVFALRSMFAK